MVIMKMIMILLLVLLCYTNGFKISLNTNNNKMNNMNANSSKSRITSRVVSSTNIKEISRPKAIKRTTKGNTSKIDSSKRQSIFNIFGILGRLDALEDTITEIKAEMIEFKYYIIFFATLYFLFDQWDKSVMRSDIKNDMDIMREERRQERIQDKEERRQDKEETKKDMDIMRIEMQKNFYITTLVAIVPLVSSLRGTNSNNNNNNNNNNSSNSSSSSDNK